MELLEEQTQEVVEVLVLQVLEFLQKAVEMVVQV
jgi:hypothetical protein